MKLTKRGINQYLWDHKQSVVIECEKIYGGKFYFRGQFVHKGKLYSADTILLLRDLAIDSDFMILSLIDGYETDFKRKTLT